MTLGRRLSGLLRVLSKPATYWLYTYISMLDRDVQSIVLNYGYAHLDSAAHPLNLSTHEEPHRYPLQLYHHVASAVDWIGLDALEVGSGRGGGSAYIMRYFAPRSILGLDLAAKAIDFCARHYRVEGLSFVRGDAESMHLADNTFDIVINVESSLYYPNVERFFEEVVRVLKPGGYFLYTDLRYWEEMDAWRAQLRSTGLQLIKEEDITPNVMRALELDHARRQKLIERYVPKWLRSSFAGFAGVTGAKLAADGPRMGERIYMNFVFQKRASAPRA
jgi:SAM-dependent methyltransferase